MGDSKEAFKQGLERSSIKSYRQAFVRAAIDGTLVAFLIWGPFRFWVRLLVAVFVRFVYGIIASSRRFGTRL